MRFLPLIYLLFSSCAKKFIQKTEKHDKIDSPAVDSNVLSIVNEAQNYDYLGPWIWFGLIIGIVLFCSFSSLIFKK
jgi:hypothetical protein